MKIEVHWESTPALWSAYDSDNFDGAPDSGFQAQGFGKTREEALNQLVEQLVDQAYDEGLRDGQKARAA